MIEAKTVKNQHAGILCKTAEDIYLHQSQDDGSTSSLLSCYSQLPKLQVNEAAEIKEGVKNS